MGGSDENNPSGIITQSSIQGGMPVRGGKLMAPIGHNRRALRERNGNNIGAPHPVAVDKGASLGLGVTRKDVGSENIPPNANHGHRPVTRRLAAQVANSQQQYVIEEPKKPNHLGLSASASASEDFDDCVVIDMDEFKAGNDTSVPMFIQHTEAMLEEIDRMDEEIEMEDIDEAILDIDSGDKDNALAVTEYVDDIYIYYKKVENTSCVPPNYMDRQPDINGKMRAILIDWLIEVHYKFELMEETLYLTVNLIDRFLARQPVVRKKLQLVGVTAMLVACKYEEVSVPVVEDLILISDKAYSRQDVLAMERLMINSLQFNLSVPTPFVFMRRFLKAAEADKKLELVSFFLIELSLVEYEVLRFPPSLLAAAAVFTAQCTVKGSKHWNKTCEWHTGYSQEQLMDCSWLMVTFHQKAATGKLTGVHRKYSLSKFGFVADCKPAVFLLESAMAFNGWKCLN